jgi:hypothetical protein
MTDSVNTPDTTGPWNNERLASELGNPYSGSRPGGASWAQIGRSQLLGAMGLKSSARVMDSVTLIKRPAPYSPFGITNGLVTSMIKGKHDLFLSGFGKPQDGKGNGGPRGGDVVDVEA